MFGRIGLGFLGFQAQREFDVHQHHRQDVATNIHHQKQQADTQDKPKLAPEVVYLCQLHTD